ncbi:tRNA(fMet)-specific endonuclease VapC [uncultured archaeon]|nr:tRNA(fMet)-specific endonuclease VapC [uncultured archaeon]
MIESLDLLPAQSKVFIDTNIFLYDILGYTKFRTTCMAFLQKMEAHTYSAATSTQVLNEVIHKLILAEITKTYRLRNESDAMKLIKERPETISSLRQVWKSYAEIKEYPLVIYSIDEATLDMAADLSNRFGLLISDATHAAVMKAQGITNIATNDSDFERVNGIDIYKP